MSVLVRLGVRSTILSLIETCWFFLVMTPVYFIVVSCVYALASRQWQGFAELVGASGVLASSFKILPVWMLIVEGLGYLLLITIYWAPGQAEANTAEVRALALFLAMAVVALVVVMIRVQGFAAVSGVVREVFTSSPPG